MVRFPLPLVQTDTLLVGISTPEKRIGTYKEFTRDLLPRIKKLGYNTIQLMCALYLDADGTD